MTTPYDNLPSDEQQALLEMLNKIFIDDEECDALTQLQSMTAAELQEELADLRASS